MSCTLSTGHFPAISDDLVNSYHLLLCCLDLLYSNALFTRNRRELLNPNFEGIFLHAKIICFSKLQKSQLFEVHIHAFALHVGLPQDFGNRDFRVPADVPCIVERLCNRHQGTVTCNHIIGFTFKLPHLHII